MAVITCERCGESFPDSMDSCPNCGRKSGVNVSESAPDKKSIKQITNVSIAQGVRTVWSKLTFASKIVFLLYLFTSVSMISSEELGETVIERVSTWLFGYVLFVGITQYISLKKRASRNRSHNNPNVIQSTETAPLETTAPSSRDYDAMEGHEFEYYCADLLRANNFKEVEVTRGSGDQGIDILAIKDGIKYGIQCKCYSSDIGNKAVQEVFAGKTFYNCHVAAVLTNRHFTASAKQLAESNGVLLWDREYLNSLCNTSI